MWKSKSHPKYKVEMKLLESGVRIRGHVGEVLTLIGGVIGDDGRRYHLADVPDLLTDMLNQTPHVARRNRIGIRFPKHSGKQPKWTTIRSIINEFETEEGQRFWARVHNVTQVRVRKQG